MRLTVPLKSKLPVSSHFSQDESRVSQYKILISSNKTLVLQQSLKRKFWNTAELTFLGEEKHLSRDAFICAIFKMAHAKSRCFCHTCMFASYELM